MLDTPSPKLIHYKRIWNCTYSISYLNPWRHLRTPTLKKFRANVLFVCSIVKLSNLLFSLLSFWRPRLSLVQHVLGNHTNTHSHTNTNTQTHLSDYCLVSKRWTLPTNPTFLVYLTLQPPRQEVIKKQTKKTWIFIW